MRSLPHACFSTVDWMQPHFLPCHHGNGVSQQSLNDLTWFYLHPIIRRTDDEWSAELVVYCSRGIIVLINGGAQ